MRIRARHLTIAAALVGTLVLSDASASADVGLTGASRHAGRPDATVRLRVDCGFCFPPCRGPKGHRHPAGFAKRPCMLDGGKEPPASFAISLLPLARARHLLSCEMRHYRLCPRPTAPPRHHPYAYLGDATPPPGGNNPEGGAPPRYLLKFRIPHLPPGEYSYVLWCDACLDGRSGSVVVDPESPVWRLRVLPWPESRSRPPGHDPGRAGSALPKNADAVPPNSHRIHRTAARRRNNVPECAFTLWEEEDGRA